MLSPTAAAQIAGISRPIIMRAITDGDLEAIRRNNGHWAIEREALDTWMNRRTIRAKTDKTPVEPPSSPARDPDDIAKIDALTEQLGDMRERIGRLEGEATANAARMNDLIEARDAARADLSEARAQITGLADYRDQLRRELTATGAQLDQITGERDKIRAENEKATATAKRLKSEIEGIRARGFFQRLFGS